MYSLEVSEAMRIGAVLLNLQVCLGYEYVCLCVKCAQRPHVITFSLYGAG